MGKTDIQLKHRLEVLERELRFAGVGTCRCTFDGVIVEIDRGTLGLLDLEDKVKDPLELAGRNIAELLVCVEAPGKLREQIRTQGELRNVVYHYRTLSGKERWALVDGRLVVDPRTGEQTVQVIGKDITELQRAEEEFRKACAELEKHLAERSAELERANERFQEQIRERERAEEALRQERDFTAAALDTVGALVLVFDVDGRIIRVNRTCERATGYSSDETLGKQVTVFLPPDEVPAAREALAALRGGRYRGTYETHWVAKDGTRRLIAWTSAVLRDAKGGIQYVISTGIDVTEQRRAEKSLRESEQKYRAFFDNAQVGMVRARISDGKVVDANPRFAEMFGYASREAMVAECVLLEHYADPAVREYMIEEAKRAGRINNYEAQLTRKDGTPFWVRFSAMLHLETDSIEGVAIDVTEEKQTKDALERQREEYQTILDSVPALIWYKDRNSVIVRANKAAAKAAGMPPQEMMGKTTRKLYPELADHYESDDREVMESGEPKLGIIEPFPLATGKTRWVRTDKVPYRDRAGNVIGEIVLAVDITDRKRAEESLREGEERFRELFEYAHDLIFTIDISTRGIATINNAARDALSYEPEELIGKPISAIVNPDFLPAVEENLSKAIAGTPTSVEAWCRRKDGTPVLLDFRMRAIAKPMVHVIAYDVTERRRESEAAKRLSLVLQQRVREETASLAEANRRLRQIQAQLIQSEKLAALGQLAAGVSHEINNPLSFVSNNLVVLRRDYQSILDVYRTLKQAVAETDSGRRLALFDEAHEQAERANIEYIAANLDRVFARTIEGTDRIRKIVRDMLDFARLGEAEWKEANVNQALDTTISMLTHDIKAKNIDLVREFRPLPLLYCMPGRINQVFLNVLLNAIQAVPEGGKIIVSTWAYHDGIKVAIVDNGMGIPKENLNRVFDPFFTTKPRGTGLGLSISYTIIAEHGGQIEVESQVGKGSTFTVVLPFRKPSDRQGKGEEGGKKG